jgi:hypothetical protein
MSTESRRPFHLAVLLGGSTVGYAAALAVVTALQSTSDAGLIASREPLARTTGAIVANHDVLEQAVADATDRYTALADRYADLAPRIGDLEGALDALTGLADTLTESTRSLPTRVSLPAVRSAPAPAPAGAPRTHAVTGASG